MIAEEFIAFKTRDSGNELVEQLRIVNFMMYLELGFGLGIVHWLHRRTLFCAAKHSQKHEQQQQE